MGDHVVQQFIERVIHVVQVQRLDQREQVPVLGIHRLMPHL